MIINYVGQKKIHCIVWATAMHRQRITTGMDLVRCLLGENLKAQHCKVILCGTQRDTLSRTRVQGWKDTMTSSTEDLGR
eukprot:UN13958